MNYFRYAVALLLVMPVYAQINFTYTGVTLFAEKKILSDVSMDIKGGSLTWQFYHTPFLQGEVSVGSSDIIIPANYPQWTDLKSKGMFSASYILKRRMGFAYLSGGVVYRKISGEVEAVIAGDNSISDFDKFIQKNSYYLYEVPVSFGLRFGMMRTFAFDLGFRQSYYYGRHIYSQYIYQGLSDVLINKDNYTFSDRDDMFVEISAAFNMSRTYRLGLEITFPYVENDFQAGFNNKEKRTISLFLGRKLQ